MRNLFASAVCLGVLGVAGPSLAADYSVITMDVAVDRSPDAVWKKIGDFCAVSDWLKMTCVYAAGSGDVGTVRRLNGQILEIMVGKTPHSYTYTQPDTKILYHGTLDVQPLGGGKKSKIVYTLIYDQEPLATPEAKQANREQRTTRFNAALQTMKAMAEGK